MFTASYPASFLTEGNSKGFHVRFPDLPETLTAGEDLADTLVQAADCLAEAIAGRIARADPIPAPSKAKRGQRLISVRSIGRQSWPYTLPSGNAAYRTPSLRGGSA